MKKLFVKICDFSPLYSTPSIMASQKSYFSFGSVWKIQYCTNFGWDN